MANAAMNERIANRTVFKRPGEPQDIANAIAFLCSDLAVVRDRHRAQRLRRRRAASCSDARPRGKRGRTGGRLHFPARVIRRDERSSDDAPAGWPRIHGASSRHRGGAGRAARGRRSTLLAGSPSRLATGTTIAGVDVGGLSRAGATALLSGACRAGRASAGHVRRRPDGRSSYTPTQLGVRSDWAARGRQCGAVDGRIRARARRASSPQPSVRCRCRAADLVLPVGGSARCRADRRRGRPTGGERRCLRRGLDVPGDFRARRCAPRSERSLGGRRRRARVARARSSRSRCRWFGAAPETTAGELAEAVAALRVAASAPVTLQVGGVAHRRAARACRTSPPASLGWRDAGVARRAAGRPLALEASRATVNRPPRDATFAVVSGTISDRACSARPGARRGGCAPVDRTRDAIRRRHGGPRSSVAHRPSPSARRPTPRRWGSRAWSARTRRPTAARRGGPQRPARRRSDRRRARRAGRHVSRSTRRPASGTTRRASRKRR